MANTKQGIYYQDNYNSVADVPADMKKMAESIDTELETDRGRLSTTETNIQSLQTDNTTNKKDISDIKQEQTTQNANITKNTSDITEIKSKNATQDEEIANIHEKDTAQDTNIETLTQRLNEKENQIAELEDKVSDLNNNQIYGRASGEYVHLVDSAKMECSISPRGNSKQNVTEQGKNLLDSSFSSFSSNGITATYNKDTQEITINGECTKNNTGLEFKCFAGVELKTDEKIYAKVKYISGSCTGGNDCAFGIFNADWTKHAIVSLNGIEGDLTKVFTAYSDTSMINAQIRFDNGDVCDNLKIKLMVSKEDVAYEPFVPDSPSFDYPSEIESVSSANVKVCNKNLADIENGENKFIDGVGRERTSKADWGCKDYIKFESNRNCIISLKEICNYLRLSEFDENRNFIKNTEVTKANVLTITTHKNTKLLKWSFNYNSNAIDVNIAKTLCLQLKEGTATDYIPHEEQNYPVDMQEPFRGMPSNTNVDFYNHIDSEGNKYIRDCFVQKDGKLYEGHYIKRIVADGINYKADFIFPSGWFVLRDANNNTIKNSLKIKDWAKLGIIKCNKLKTITTADIQQKNTQGIASSSEGEIAIKLDDATKETSTWTTDTVNAFLQENPLTIDYALAEPYYIECTETQKAQLQALQKAKTYKNITNITTDTIAVLDVDYKKDLETIINNINTAIVSLGGV